MNIKRTVLAIIAAPLMLAILMIVIPVILSLSWPFNETDYKLIIAFSAIVGYSSLAAMEILTIYWLRE
jgi:hypothetical protein